MYAVRHLSPLAILAFAALPPLAQAADCPPGPFYCVTWGPSGPMPGPTTPPPAPFKLAGELVEIRPTVSAEYDKLPGVLKSRREFTAASASDKEKIIGGLGAATTQLDSATYYFAPKSNGKAFYFKGGDLVK